MDPVSVLALIRLDVSEEAGLNSLFSNDEKAVGCAE